MLSAVPWPPIIPDYYVCSCRTHNSVLKPVSDRISHFLCISHRVSPSFFFSSIPSTTVHWYTVVLFVVESSPSHQQSLIRFLRVKTLGSYCLARATYPSLRFPSAAHLVPINNNSLSSPWSQLNNDTKIRGVAASYPARGVARITHHELPRCGRLAARRGRRRPGLRLQAIRRRAPGRKEGAHHRACDPAAGRWQLCLRNGLQALPGEYGRRVLPE